ncbi:unnamed protein product [Lupinus luteus]|uniref:Minus-end-directed kinesin ATPase n=1 Tax=Lupinus luteus TaxID=3873 RepID=A0AAV1VZ11_LUPLU
MGTEQLLPFSVVSVVDDVPENHGGRLSDVNLASRKAEEVSLRRNEAAGWLRKTVGVVGGKDLPAEPSEEDFRLGLRSGIILCNVLNKIQPGAVPKVVEAPNDSVLIPDGAALSIYQYFENVRNFLVAMEEMGIPTFEASDLEQGSFPSLHSLVREYLCDKKPEEIPICVETLLSKVMEECERRTQIQNESLKTTQEEKTPFEVECSNSKASSVDEEMEEKDDAQDLQSRDELQEESYDKHNIHEESSSRNLKTQELIQQQNRSIQQLYGLATAASGYHKVIEENRKLYNQVQDLKGNIRVYCRVRPFLGGQTSQNSSVSNVEEGSISVITPSKYSKEGRKTFNFNRAFGPSATQAEVFSDMQPLVRSVLDGYNVCIFAYGQTGSGKTHTMSGPDELNEETIGVNYRALRDLFLISEQRKDTILYDISVQMLEIYNEQVRDLLTTDGGQAKTLMFVHISPELEALGETLSTLKFAERVSTVELGAAKVNKSSNNSDVKELKEQIASLKAALAKKDGEPKMKSYGFSPTRFGSKKPRDDFSTPQGQKNATSKLKRRSLDIHEMYRNSPQWPHVGKPMTNTKEDDKESSTSSDWIDKTMMKRNDSLNSVDSLMGQWEISSPKMCNEPSLLGYDMNINDELDELEIATSDSSESDMNWLSSTIPKPISISNELASMPKKLSTRSKSSKIPESRSMIPSSIPTPSRKISTLVNQPKKQPGTIDVKRRLSK